VVAYLDVGAVVVGDDDVVVDADADADADEAAVVVVVVVVVAGLPLRLLQTLYHPDDLGGFGGETIVVVEDCSSLISFSVERVIGYMMERSKGYYYYQSSSYCTLCLLKSVTG